MVMSAKQNNSRFSLKAHDLSSHMFLASFMSLYILIQRNNTYNLNGCLNYSIQFIADFILIDL